MELNQVAKNLQKRGYAVRVCESVEECRQYLQGQIQGKTIGIGGSVTVAELNLFPTLSRQNTVFWHGDKTQVERMGHIAVRDAANDAQIYIASVNGMSEEGVIINIDYTGNRIAATCYGHEKVYLLVGKNKIAPDFQGALWRARNIASPKNAQRLGRKTPCAVKGDRCYDCNSPQRICNGFLVFDRAMAGTNTEVILLNGDFGY